MKKARVGDMEIMTLHVQNPVLRRILEERLKDEPVRFSDEMPRAPGALSIWAGDASLKPAPGIFAEANMFATPLRFGALADRIYALKKRTARKEEIFIGPYRFDEAMQELHDAKRAIRLTDKEACILKLLAEAQGAIVTREDMLAGVWGYAEGIETHTLETHIYRLRQKIEDNPAHPDILVTAGSGYRLTLSGA